MGHHCRYAEINLGQGFVLHWQTRNRTAMKHPFLACKQKPVSKGQLALRSTLGMRSRTVVKTEPCTMTAMDWGVYVDHKCVSPCATRWQMWFWPQFNCTRAFWPAQCLKRRLWIVFITKEENGICCSLCPVISCCRYKNASSPLAQASCCGSKCYGCKYGNTINKAWWHKDVLVFGYNLFR